MRADTPALDIKVAPLVGAWIEISHWLFVSIGNIVAPLVGAWIEIRMMWHKNFNILVAPLVGAWIEIRVMIRWTNYPTSLLL